MGQESKQKARSAGDKAGKPPSGTGTAESAGNPGDKPPSGTAFQRKSQCRFPPGRRGAGGEAPGKIN